MQVDFTLSQNEGVLVGAKPKEIMREKTFGISYVRTRLKIFLFVLVVLINVSDAWLLYKNEGFFKNNFIIRNYFLKEIK